jgi:ribosomal 50S subunit-recycling heat shock protein
MFLKKVYLIRSRSLAKTACDKKMVKINGQIAKASSEVKKGDAIEFSIYDYKNKIKIIELPLGNVSKKDSAEYYEIVSRQKISSNE